MKWEMVKSSPIRALRRIACVAFVAALLAAGCEEDKKSENWKFTNNSSYKVNVRSNGQTWLPIMVSPGQTVHIDWDGRIEYVYSPSNRVQPTDGDGNTVVFINR